MNIQMRKTNMFSVFITNLGKYNEGEIIGRWIQLPIDDDELKAVLKGIGVDGIQYEEYFMTDFEIPISCQLLGIDIYSSISELNNMAREISTMNAYELAGLEAFLSMGYPFCSATRKTRNGDYIFYPGVHDMNQVARRVLSDTGYIFSTYFPEDIRRYLNYDLIARDLTMLGTFVELDAGIVEILE